MPLLRRPGLTLCAMALHTQSVPSDCVSLVGYLATAAVAAHASTRPSIPSHRRAHEGALHHVMQQGVEVSA